MPVTIGGAVKGILGEVMPTRTGTEDYTRCCPSLHRVHGGRGFGTLCHVCWKPATFGNMHVWKGHIYHVDCGEAPPLSLRGSDR